VVYGKLGKSNFSATNNFFDDEDELASAAPTVGRHANLKAAYPVQKTEVKTHKLKAAKPRMKRQDTFDVPSSEDETQAAPDIRSPPKYRPRLVDNSKTDQLTSWEKKRLEGTQQSDLVTRTAREQPATSPEAHLKNGSQRVQKSPESAMRTASPARPRLSPAKDSGIGNDTISAAARLAARRNLVEKNTALSDDESPRHRRTHSKRSAQAEERSESTSRKRPRTIVGRASDDDVQMVDATSSPVEQVELKETRFAATEKADVYDFPDASDDEESSPWKPASTLRSNAGNWNSRRGKPIPVRRSTPQKGSSAPARLAAMVGTDTDTTEPPTRSPSIAPSPRSTPQPPATPPPAGFGSLDTAIKAGGTITPKQANLWSRLLPSDTAAPSPSALPMKDLNISGGKRNGNTTYSRRLTKSQSDGSRRRTRLVDRLKASAPESEEDASSDEGEDERDDEASESFEQMDVTRANPVVGRPMLHRQTSQSQSQSQAASNPGIGPKITYARVRSYLPEDNAEEDLMLGLDEGLSQRSNNGMTASAMQSQRSAFDMDESDDDESGKMRSIHELRASGSTARGMGDIDDLLDDIAKHGITQRGTRRAALISLATKMMDKSFKARFIGQGCDARLAAECGACSDEVADSLLLATISLLLEGEPAEHVVASLQDVEITSWLVPFLSNSTQLRKLAKERKSNMSKASQASYVDLVNKITSNSALWNDEAVDIITPRTMALKALDLLIRTLRRLGDRSELLNGSQIDAVLQHSVHEGDQVDLGLAISILEALSTTAASLNWSPSAIQRVARMFLSFDSSTPSQLHNRFLALRLCLNLTNANPGSCSVIADMDEGSFVTELLVSIDAGFKDIALEVDAEKKAVALDLLVLAIGIMINLTEHSASARSYAMSSPDTLASLIKVFEDAQKNMLDAESEAETVANVAFGYLAVMLANLCQDPEARKFIASKLPKKTLTVLVEALEEFVAQHQRVDMLGLELEGEEGKAVWGGFTEVLKGVLGRLKGVAEMV
jgi:hypothetical protein